VIEFNKKCFKALIAACFIILLCGVSQGQNSQINLDLEKRPMTCMKAGYSIGRSYTTLNKFWHSARTFGISLRYPFWIFKGTNNLVLDIEYLNFPAKSEVVYPVTHVGNNSQSKIQPENTSIINASLDFYVFTGYRQSAIRGYFLLSIGYMARGDFKISPLSEILPGEKTSYKSGYSQGFGIGLELKVTEKTRMILGWRLSSGNTSPGWSSYNQFHISIGYII